MITKQNRKPKANYTLIDNSVFTGGSLSLSGIGLFCLLSSLPDNWDLNAKGLATRYGFGEKEIRTRLKELVDKKYLVREQRRAGGHFSGFDYRIYPSPHAAIPEGGAPRSGLPDARFGRQYNKTINNKTEKKENKNKDDLPCEFADVEF